MKSHGCSTFEVSKFVVSGSGVTVFVEELGYWCSVLGEVCVTAVGFPFLIVIDNVIGLRWEEFTELFILENLIENVNFINSRFGTLVSNTGQQAHGEEAKVNFPDESLTSHHETESAPCSQSATPSIVGSMKSMSNLVKVISSTHSPFPVIVSEHVIAERMWGRISVGLTRFSHGSDDIWVLTNINVVSTMRWSESQIVMSGCHVFAESSWLKIAEHADSLL